MSKIREVINLNDLKILITASLNTGKSIGDINTQLKAISKKVEKLKIRIDIDDKIINKLNKFATQMNNVASVSNELNKVLKTEEEIIKKLDGTTEKFTRTFLKSGDIIEKTRKVTEQSRKAKEQEVEATKKLIDVEDKLGKKLKETSRYDSAGKLKSSSRSYGNDYNKITVNTNAQDEVTGSTEVKNFEKKLKDQEKREREHNEHLRKIANERKQIRKDLQSLSSTGLLTDIQKNTINNSIITSKSVEDIQRAKSLLEQATTSINAQVNSRKELNKETAKQYEQQKKLTEKENIRVQNLGNRVGRVNDKSFSSDFSSEKANMEKYIKEIYGINTAVSKLERVTNSAGQQIWKFNAQVKGLKDIENVKGSIDKTTKSIYEQSRAIKDNHKNLSLLDAFKTAMVKMPIWLASGTAIFGTIHTFQEFTRVIVEVDTAITNLKKVMAPDTSFEDMLDGAIAKGEQFAKTISGVLSSYETFAKQGFNQQQIDEMTDAALITSNVGELEAGQAAEYLTSSIIQLKLETKDAMSVIDAWNSVSNQNATTVEKLAQGHARAASTARSFGLDMHELNAVIGTTTAATKQSGNEIGNFVKNVLPRLLGKPAQGALSSIGVALNDENGEMRKAVDIYADVAEQFENLSQAQRNMVAEGLAGKYHISRMTALLSNWDLYEKQLADSINSKNSAMNENATYMQSMTAKIELLKHGFETLALAVGNAFLSDGFVGIVKGLTDLAKAGAWVADTIGALPVIFATAGVAAIVFSGRIQTLVLQSELATIAFAKLGVASKRMQLALATTGVGIGLVALGVILEKIIGKYSEFQRKQEEAQQQAERYNKASQDTYLNEKDKLDKLIQSYKKYSEAKEQGTLTNEEEKEYLKIQSELASIFPNLISYIDSKGQAHLREASEIDKVIDSTREMIQLKKDEIALNAQSSLDKRQGEVSSIKDEISSKKEDLETYQNLAETHILKSQREAAKKEANQIEQELVLLRNRLSIAEKGINKEVLKISDAFNNMDLKVNPRVAKDVSDLVSTLDFSKLSTTELELASKKISDSMEKISGSAEKGNQDSFSKNVKTLITDLESLGVKGNALQDFSIPFDKARNSLLLASGSANQAANEIDRLNLASEEGIGTTSEASKVYDIFGNEVSEAADELSEIEKLQLAMVGATSDSTEGIQQLINSYMVLSEQTVKTAEQEQYLAEVTEKLSSIYPHLVDAKGLNIQAMAEEHKSMKIMLEATEKFANGQMDSQEAMVYATASATQARINLMKEEIKALMAFITAYETAVPTDIYGNQMADNRAMRKYDYSTDKVAKLQEALRSLNADFNVQAVNLGELIGFQDDYDKGSEKNSKSTKNQIYVTDKYKTAIEELNTELAKLKELQDDYPKWSDEYQKSLRKEIELIEKKKKLTNDQAWTLGQQIKSGKIKPTGMIDLGESTTVSTASTSSKATGGGNASVIWNFFKSKGFSDAIVAGIMGNLQLESGLSTTALNKSSGAFGLAQWLGGRKTALSNFANSSGTSMSDINTQLNFLWKELNSTEKRTMNYLNANQGASASTIAAAFDKLFERSEGTHVPQRQKYANQFLAQYAGKGAVAVSASIGSSSTSNPNNAKAEMAQAVDSAKSDYQGLLQDIYSMEEMIQQLRFQLVEAELAKWEHKIERANVLLEAHQIKLSKLDPLSTAYTDELEKQLSTLEYQRKAQNELTWTIDYQAKKNKHLTKEQAEALRDRYFVEVNALNEVRNKIEEIQQLIRTSEIERITNKLNKATENLSDRRDSIGRNADRIDEDDPERNRKLIEAYQEQIILAQREKQQIENTIKTLAAKRTSMIKAGEDVSFINEQIEELQDRLTSVDDTSFNLKDQLKDVYEEIADTAIEAYKAYYEQKRELDEQAIEDEIDAFKKSHDEKMELLDEELDKYQDIINAKLESIDRQESQDDYNKEVAKRQEEIQKTQSQINILAMDDSREAQTKRTKLEEELKQQQLDLAELVHDREVDLRKQNLQDELKHKEDLIDAEKDKNEQELEEFERLQDNKLKEIEQYYENLLNDERYWSQMRQDIMAGELTNMGSTIMDFQSVIHDNMSKIGESISKNLIDKLSEAMNLLQQIQSGGSYEDVVGGNTPIGGKPAKLTEADMKLMASKFIESQILPGTKASNVKKGLQDRVTGYKQDAIANGALLDSNASYGSLLGSMSEQEKLLFAKYIRDVVVKGIETESVKDKMVSLTDVLAKNARKVNPKLWETLPFLEALLDYQSFDTGGMTKGDGFAMLHDKEIVLNKVDTTNILEAVKITRNFADIFKNFKLPSITPNLAGEGGIHIDVHIDNMHGTKKDADNVFTTIANKLRSRGV
jgi:TP901 family phage tail tape measure protein